MKNQMKQKEANTTIGYNLCPSCGRPAQAILADDSTYYVGCPMCGLKNGVCADVSDGLTDEVEEMLRITWNRRCIESTYDVDALEMLRTIGNGYALVRTADDYMVFFTERFEDIKQFLAKGLDVSYTVYHMIDGIMEPLGSAYLVWLGSN
ncbi:MAG: hypothetical protein J6R04_02710 [Clostridia bacterium]|nr:hypothetical protein [Clostridia bacterium]